MWLQFPTFCDIVTVISHQNKSFGLKNLKNSILESKIVLYPMGEEI